MQGAYTVSERDRNDTLTIKSRVAILGTLADLHQEPIKYNLRALRRLVKELKPDLLCAEIHPDDWQVGDLSQLPPEYRESLIPLSRRTDIIIIPISHSRDRELVAPMGRRWLSFRQKLVRLLNGQLRIIQRLANGPRAINSGAFGLVCNSMCSLTAWVCGPEARLAWDVSNQAILDNIIEVVQRDPGRRVLVTVDCRRRHRLERRLREVDEVELVSYHRL